MRREKSIAVRFAALGGQALKAEMRDIGTTGKAAMDGIQSGAGGGADGLGRIAQAAAQARSQLDALAAKSAQAAANLRQPGVGGGNGVQDRINQTTGVTREGGMSSAEVLSLGQALDDVRAKFNPLFGIIRDYKNEVSEIRASHAAGAISADEMSAAIGKVRTESLGAIDKLKGISAAAREKALAMAAAERADLDAAAASAKQAASLDAQRAQYNPLYRVIRDYRAEVTSIRASHAAGAISADEMSDAIGRVRTSSLQAIDKLKGITAAAREKAAAVAASEQADNEAATAAARHAAQLDAQRAKYNPLYAVIRSYLDQVRDMRAAHADGALSADELRAAQDRVRTSSLQAIDKIKGLTAALREKSAAEEKARADTLAHGQAMDAMRAKYNPIFAILSRYKAEQAAIRQAHKEGALSADEQTAALVRLRQAAMLQLATARGQTDALEQVSRSSRGATLRMQNLTYQLNDIGVTLAGGMNPFMILAQQGPQIAQIYGFGNGGVGAIFKDLGGLIKAIPTPIKAVGLAAALGAVGILDMRDAINETSDVTVTFGDTALAVFQVLASRISTMFDPITDAVSSALSKVWDSIASGFIWSMNVVLNSTNLAGKVVRGEFDRIAGIAVAAYQGIRDNWGLLPSAIGDFAYQAANSLIDGVESMLNAVAARINGFIATMNSALSYLPEWATGEGGLKIGEVGTVDLGNIANPYEGAGEAIRDVGRRITEAAGKANEGWANAREIMSADPMGEFFDDVSVKAQENARKRLEDEKGGGGRAKAAKAEKDEVAELIKKLQEELLVLRETDPVKKRLLGYSEEMKDATAAERAQIEELVRTLDRAEHGWEAVGRALADYAEESKRLGGELGDSLVKVFDGAGDAFAEMVAGNSSGWRDMVEQMAKDWAKLAFQQHIGGPLAAYASSWLGSFGGSGDVIADTLTSAGLQGVVPSLDGGGYTGNKPRSGGLDGKGGFLAMLHPQEDVIDRTKKGGGGGRGGGGGEQVMVGIDPKNGNIQAYVDRRISEALPSAFDNYSRNALPYAIQQYQNDPRSVG